MASTLFVTLLFSLAVLPRAQDSQVFAVSGLARRVKESAEAAGNASSVRAAPGPAGPGAPAPVALSGVNFLKPALLPEDCLWAFGDRRASHQNLKHGPDWCGLSDGRVGLWETKGGLWKLELVAASSNSYLIRSLRHPDQCLAIRSKFCHNPGGGVCAKSASDWTVRLMSCEDVPGGDGNRWIFQYVDASRYVIRPTMQLDSCLQPRSSANPKLILSPSDCSLGPTRLTKGLGGAWKVFEVDRMAAPDLAWIDRKVRPDVDFSRLTWQGAQELCRGFGADLCFRGDVCPSGQDAPPAPGKWDFLQETLPSQSDNWAAYRVCQGPQDSAVANKWIQVGQWAGPDGRARTCLPHLEAANVEAAWGTSAQPQSFRNAVACCAQRAGTCEAPLLQGAWRSSKEPEASRLAKEAQGKRLSELDLAHRDDLLRSVLSMVGVEDDHLPEMLAKCHAQCASDGDLPAARLDADILKEHLADACPSTDPLRRANLPMADKDAKEACESLAEVLIMDSFGIALSVFGLGSALGRKIGRAYANSIVARVFGSEEFRQGIGLLHDAWHSPDLWKSIVAVFQFLGGLYNATGVRVIWKAINLVMSWWDIVATGVNIVAQFMIWFSGLEALAIGGEVLQLGTAIGSIFEDVLQIQDTCPESLP